MTQRQRFKEFRRNYNNYKVTKINYSSTDISKFDLSQQDIKQLNKFFPKGIVCFDVETTGLSPLMHEIIEIAGIKVHGHKVEFFSKLIKPNITIPDKTIKIHGITNEAVKDADSAKIVIPQFLDFIRGHSLVAHNAKFDVGFLVNYMHHKKLEIFFSEIYCSCKLARQVIKSENHKLSTLCEFLEISLENHHRALDDSVATIKVFARSLAELTGERHLKKGYLFNLKDFANKEMLLPKKIEGLKEYVDEQKVVDIKYRGGSMKGQYRPIRPLSFLPLPEGNVLYAHCLTSDLYKSFKLTKIADFRETANKENDQGEQS